MGNCYWCDETYENHCPDCVACFDEHSIDCESQYVRCDWCDSAADLFGRQWAKVNWSGAENVCFECEDVLQDQLIEVLCSIDLSA